MQPAVVHYYVWYRVDAETTLAQRVIEALLDDVAAHTGIRGRLQKRRDDATTWLEIYENVTATATFEHALAAAVVKHRAAACARDHARHTEAFVAPD